MGERRIEIKARETLGPKNYLRIQIELIGLATTEAVRNAIAGIIDEKQKEARRQEIQDEWVLDAYDDMREVLNSQTDLALNAILLMDQGVGNGKNEPLQQLLRLVLASAERTRGQDRGV